MRRAPLASADLEDIWMHIALDSVQAAETVVDQIYRAEMRLAEFPELGRKRDELLQGLRSWPIGSYLVFYRIEPGAVVILRILHGARDLRSAFDGT